MPLAGGVLHPAPEEMDFRLLEKLCGEELFEVLLAHPRNETYAGALATASMRSLQPPGRFPASMVVLAGGHSVLKKVA